MIQCERQTSVCRVDSLDSSVLSAALFLNPADDCYSDPALSGVRGLNSELMTEQHNLLLSPYIQIIYNNRKCSCYEEIYNKITINTINW